jgi:phosphocarrier protein
MNEPDTSYRRVEIVNAHGLHMRPADKFVKLACSFQSEVAVNHGGITANGKSILDMACLAAECGATLDLEARGPDAEEALSALADLVAAGFHMTDEDYRNPEPDQSASGNSLV